MLKERTVYTPHTVYIYSKDLINFYYLINVTFSFVFSEFKNLSSWISYIRKRGFI
jgi:hypothetical protein